MLARSTAGVSRQGTASTLPQSWESRAALAAEGGVYMKAENHNGDHNAG
jgi:hypothetical protein